MSAFRLGVIEGFYGRQWSWSERRDMATFLAAAGYSHYLYAPKGDSGLRGQWRQPFTNLDELCALARHCQSQGLRFGVGLSPMGLQQAFSDSDRARFQARLAELEAIKLDTLWILFDDMRGDHPGLAAVQCQVMREARSLFSGELAMCPTYYSFDPVLDEVFGERPPGYLEALASGLDDSIDLLWTGSRVISEQLRVEDCVRFTELTGRKPLLWDNYPVNDGRKTSPFLHLNAFTGREPGLSAVAAGHFANPMNQPSLSKIPLATLPRLYQGYTAASEMRTEALAGLPEPLATLLARDWEKFQREGRDQISENDRQQLLQDYRAIRHPAATEVCDWLKGVYRFDPDCLTG